MVTLNTIIEADAYQNPKNGNSAVAARFGVDHPLSLLIEKSVRPFDGLVSYQIDITAEGNKPRYDARGLSFETTTSGLRIGVESVDLEAIKAAFLSAALILEMYQEDHVPESIGVTVAGLPNHMLHQCIFDETGEPRLEKPMFTPSGKFITMSLPQASPLKSSPKGQLSTYREFNYLRVTNLNQFLQEYGNTIDYYESPFAILAKLEAEVKYQNNPDHVSVPYSDNGDVLFNYIQVYAEGDRRVVEYTYTGTVS